MLQAQGMAQLMHSHQEDVIPVQVLVPDSPGLRGVKVGVPSDVGAREVGVGQEATLAIEGRAVAMEAQKVISLCCHLRP